MKICIIGLGLLGGSFALGIKAVWPNTTILGVDSNPANAAKALEIGIADEILEIELAVQQADLTVLATPVNVIYSLASQVLSMLPEHATLLDLGSTKELICQAVAAHPKRDQFVAMHPIAGTEYSGPEAAFATLLNHKTMIICNKEDSGQQHIRLAEQVCQALGMHLRHMSATDHDMHLAYVSHLSHISSFALGLTVLDKETDDKHIFEMAGSGFSSTVRLAKSSPDMWAPIFTQNQANISEALGCYIVQLQKFKDAIDKQDEQQSKAMMQKANDIRRILG